MLLAGARTSCPAGAWPAAARSARVHVTAVRSLSSEEQREVARGPPRTASILPYVLGIPARFCPPAEEKPNIRKIARMSCVGWLETGAATIRSRGGALDGVRARRISLFWGSFIA